MCLYQFLIAVRSEGHQLTSVDGETTSHLMGKNLFIENILFFDNLQQMTEFQAHFIERFVCWKMALSQCTFLMENHQI